MLITVGEVLKPRGLKGELKIEIMTNRPLIFNDLDVVTVNKKQFNVLKGSVQNGFAYLNLEGIDSIEKAEQFRNCNIQIDEERMVLHNDEVLSTKLIGFEVIHNGNKIGTVKSIENYGGGDFFEIAVTGVGFIQIPNEDEFILETNMTNKTLTLTENALQEEIV